jgi:hypothetical protein
MDTASKNQTRTDMLSSSDSSILSSQLLIEPQTGPDVETLVDILNENDVPIVSQTPAEIKTTKAVSAEEEKGTEDSQHGSEGEEQETLSPDEEEEEEEIGNDEYLLCAL